MDQDAGGESAATSNARIAWRALKSTPRIPSGSQSVFGPWYIVHAETQQARSLTSVTAHPPSPSLATSKMRDTATLHKKRY